MRYLSVILILSFLLPFGVLYNPRHAQAGIPLIGAAVAGKALTASCYEGNGVTGKISDAAKGIAGKVSGGVSSIFAHGGGVENAAKEVHVDVDINNIQNELFDKDIKDLEQAAARAAKDEAIKLGKNIPGAGKLPSLPSLGSKVPVFDNDALKELETANRIALQTQKVQKAQCQKETLWDSVGYFASKMIIRQLTRSIVSWINTGNFGNSFHVLNTRDFWTDVLDETTGIFLDRFENTAICKGFKANVKLSLKINRSFEKRFRCTLSDVLNNNYDAFQNHFSVGGWDAWSNIALNPQNDPYATYFFTVQELERQKREALKAANQERSEGNGFLGLRVCKNDDIVNGDPLGRSGRLNLDCDIQTPGVLIEKALSSTLSSQVRQLELADEFNEIVTAAMNKMDIWNITGGGGGGGLGNYRVPQAPPNDELFPTQGGTKGGAGGGNGNDGRGGNVPLPAPVDPSVEAKRAEALLEINGLLDSVTPYETARASTISIIKSAISDKRSLKQCVDNQIDILNQIVADPVMRNKAPFNASAMLNTKGDKSSSLGADIADLEARLAPFEDDMNTNVLPVTSSLRDAREKVKDLTTEGGIQYVLDTKLTAGLRDNVAGIKGLGKVAEEDLAKIEQEFADFSLVGEIEQCGADLDKLDADFRNLSAQ